MNCATIFALVLAITSEDGHTATQTLDKGLTLTDCMSHLSAHQVIDTQPNLALWCEAELID